MKNETELREKVALMRQLGVRKWGEATSAVSWHIELGRDPKSPLPNDAVRSLEQLGHGPELALVVAEHRVAPSQIAGPGRSSRVVRARHDLWRLLHKKGLSFPEIAELFDRDHSTVVKAVQLATELSSEVGPTIP